MSILNFQKSFTKKEKLAKLREIKQGKLRKLL